MSKDSFKDKVQKRYGREDDDTLIFFEPDPKYIVTDWEERPLRVAAYCRVSTDNDNQQTSFALQQKEYKNYIAQHRNWVLVDIYADEGLSATSTAKREEFNRMLTDCDSGKIDLIVTKNVSRFSRNVVDCLSIARKLLHGKHRVGIFFQENNINTLVIGNEMILTMLSSLAQAESEAKREAMLWSYDKRFKSGIFLTPTNILLGYATDEDGDMVVEEESAKTVRAIYTLFLQGWPPAKIAFTLTKHNRPTGKGNRYWSSSSVRNILSNEKFCGDVVAQKSFTTDVLSHKAVKNRGQKLAIYKRNHHEAIVSRREYIQSLLLLKANQLSLYYNPDFTLKVVREGLLAGFIPISPAFGGYSPSHYVGAVEFAEVELPPIKAETVVVRNAEVVRISEFAHSKIAAVSVSRGTISFNKECVAFFGEDVPFAELLFHPVERILAVRPTTRENKNAVLWDVKPIRAVKFNETLFKLCGWTEDIRYKVMADCVRRGADKLLLFDLSSAEFIVSTQQAAEMAIRVDNEGNILAGAPGELEGQPQPVKIWRNTTQLLQPEEWRDNFGIDHVSHELACRGWLALTLEDWAIDAPAQAVDGFDNYGPPEAELITEDQVAAAFGFDTIGHGTAAEAEEETEPTDGAIPGCMGEQFAKRTTSPAEYNNGGHGQ